jgi:hypothetical protein
VLNNASYALRPNDPSTVTTQGKLLVEPGEVRPLHPRCSMLISDDRTNKVLPGHGGTGGIWEAETKHIQWPKFAGIGPVQIPGVQALSLYNYEAAPGYVLVILISRSISQTAKASYPDVYVKIGAVLTAHVACPRLPSCVQMRPPSTSNTSSPWRMHPV